MSLFSPLGTMGVALAREAFISLVHRLCLRLSLLRKPVRYTRIHLSSFKTWIQLVSPTGRHRGVYSGLFESHKAQAIIPMYTQTTYIRLQAKDTRHHKVAGINEHADTHYQWPFHSAPPKRPTPTEARHSTQNAVLSPMDTLRYLEGKSDAYMPLANKPSNISLARYQGS